MPLEISSTLRDRYFILGELGSGGMGAVYHGFDERLEVEVAIKENTVTSPEAERQFKREAKILARLHHPNLPRVTDHFVIPDEGQYLVMDFVPGETAEERLLAEDGPLPEDLVLEWARAIISALDHLHNQSQPILHRDVKPSNIKITPEDRAVLVDFGLAKLEDPSRPTTLGAKAHTPGFAPPEQYGQGRTSVRTDIYSLGATLYMLLTGRVPADAVERSVGETTLIPIRDLNPSVSPQVADAIERALSLQSASRYGSAKEFQNALFGTQPAGAEAPGATVIGPEAKTVVASRAEPTAPRKLPLLPIVGLGVLVLIVIVGGGAVLLLGGLGGGAEPTPAQEEPTSVPAVAVADSPTPSLTPTDTASPEPVVATATPELTATTGPTPVGGGSGEIAFVSERTGRPQVFLVNLDGGGLVQLTDLEDGACQPAWSPDGELLLFTSPCGAKRDQYPQGSIWVANGDGSDAHQLISVVGGAFDPDWNEAGILFTNLESGDPRIWLADPDGSNPRKITIGRSDDFLPSWSPGGDRLAFMNTSRAGSRTVFWMFPDGTFPGSNPDQVTREQVVDDPAWSPQGDLVTYVAQSALWLVPWDARGFGAERITIQAGNDDPAWSVDGRWLAFESWQSAASHDIHIMNSTGGQRNQVTDDAELDYEPAWRP